MTTLTPARAAELLALLPEPEASMFDWRDINGGLYLDFGGPDGGYRRIAELPEDDAPEDHPEWPVLAAAADALRTIVAQAEALERLANEWENEASNLYLGGDPERGEALMDCAADLRALLSAQAKAVTDGD